MEGEYFFNGQDFSNEDIFEQLNSGLIKESEILDEDILDFDGIEEIAGQSTANDVEFRTSKDLDSESQLNSDDEKDEISTVEVHKDGGEKIPNHDKSSNHLLRRTISELERALSDTRKLLSDRDTENNKVRSQLSLLQSNLEDEQGKCCQLKQDLAEKEATIVDLEGRISKDQIEISELKSQVLEKKEGVENRDELCYDGDYNELKKINIKLENEVGSLKAKLQIMSEQIRTNTDKTSSTNNSSFNTEARPKCKHFQREKNLQTKLRMKFMRDAFFYYMIDYHAEEQLRAILAILEYEDKRQDIILEAYKMRQKGRKFTVSQVSSRKLTFIQEERK